MTLPTSVLSRRLDDDGKPYVWDTQSFHEAVCAEQGEQTIRSTERLLEKADLLPEVVKLADLRDEFDRPARSLVSESIDQQARRKRHQSLIVQLHRPANGPAVLFTNDARGGRRWLILEAGELEQAALLVALDALVAGKAAILWPHGEVAGLFRAAVAQAGTHDLRLESGAQVRLGTMIFQDADLFGGQEAKGRRKPSIRTLSHLDRLEAESIQILREVVAMADNPVMLYSVGKDSSVVLHLARKAFAPSPPPFPLMHVDTRWEFQTVYDFRDEMAKRAGMELIVHTHPDGVEQDINPFDHGSAMHTDIMKTQSLKMALDHYKFDVAIGGARRDEEKSRAKERVFSFRTATHRWDPKNQRPELWNLYNGSKNPGEGIRAFPISNWTELDVWQYIYREQIPIVPLYFAAERPVVDRDGMDIIVEDDRMRLFENEEVELKRVRFRSLGCYPLTGCAPSEAASVSDIILELLDSRTSERHGRAIDNDSGASMEQKKQEGYF